LIGGDILHFARTFLPARLKLTSEGGNETDAPLSASAGLREAQGAGLQKDRSTC